MIFHAIAIKDISKKNYNINILIQADSIDLVKSFLQSYNLVVLEISEYKWDTTSFGTAEIIVLYKNKELKIISNLNNLRTIAHDFLIIWFDIKNINFTDYRKLSEQDEKSIIQQAKDDIELDKKVSSQNEDQEKLFLHDENLEKALQVTEDVLEDLQKNIYPNENLISRDKIRDIKFIEQDLIKLKMWNNVEKIVDVLDKLINKIFEAKQEILSKQKKSILFLDSSVTDIDIQQEINLLEKSKKVGEIWEKKTINDYFYAITWKFGIYLKCLRKDFSEKIKNSWFYLNRIFEIINVLIFMILILSWGTLWVLNISWSSNINLYYYVILVFFGIFGFVSYIMNFIKKWNTIKSLILIWIWLIISTLLYLFLKYNFVF